MEIQLSPEMEQIIEDKVASGRYPNASEFIREAILRAVERDQLKLSKLNEAVAIGMDQAEKGQFSNRSIRDIIERKETNEQA